VGERAGGLTLSVPLLSLHWANLLEFPHRIVGLGQVVRVIFALVGDTQGLGRSSTISPNPCETSWAQGYPLGQRLDVFFHKTQLIPPGYEVL